MNDRVRRTVSRQLGDTTRYARSATGHRTQNKGYDVKLTATQGKKVEDQFGVEVIPEDHPLHPKLLEAFGDHTFVMDATGLNIIEPDPEADNGNGMVVRLATWAEDRSALNVHDPKPLPVKVDLQADE